MTVQVNAVAFFTAVLLGTRIKFVIPDIHLYALADGIREVCAKFPRRSLPSAKDPPQLTRTFGRIIFGECPRKRSQLILIGISAKLNLKR